MNQRVASKKRLEEFEVTCGASALCHDQAAIDKVGGECHEIPLIQRVHNLTLNIPFIRQTRRIDDTGLSMTASASPSTLNTFV